MSKKVLTIVAAALDPSRSEDVVQAFRRLTDEEPPPGLLRTELLTSGDGVWEIQTLWASREALDAMRASAEPPAAPTLLRALGGRPTIRVVSVEVELLPPELPG